MKELSLDAQARVVERWKTRRGVTGRFYMPINNGARRTASKRALLRAMRESARSSVRSAGFQAAFLEDT